MGNIISTLKKKTLRMYILNIGSSYYLSNPKYPLEQSLWNNIKTRVVAKFKDISILPQEKLPFRIIIAVNTEVSIIHQVLYLH